MESGMYEWTATLVCDGSTYEVRIWARNARDAVAIIMANYQGDIVVAPHHR